MVKKWVYESGPAGFRYPSDGAAGRRDAALNTISASGLAMALWDRGVITLTSAPGAGGAAAPVRRIHAENADRDIPGTAVAFFMYETKQRGA